MKSEARAYALKKVVVEPPPVTNKTMTTTTSSANTKGAKHDDSEFDRDSSLSSKISTTNSETCSKFDVLLLAASKNSNATTTGSIPTIPAGSEQDKKKNSSIIKKESTATSPSSKLLSYDVSYDVYMGRGGGLNKLRRDSFYRKLILQNYEGYCGMKPIEKRDYALMEIVTPIRKLGGKFYLPSAVAAGDNLWEIGSDDDVVSRVMQSLRDCKKEEKQYNKKNEKKNAGRPDVVQSFSRSSMSLRVSLKNENKNENETTHNKDEQQPQQQKQIAKLKMKTNNKKPLDNSATVADFLCQRYYKQRSAHGTVEERQNVTKKDEGFDAVTPTTNQDNNSNQKKKEKKKRKNIYLNEVNGHMLNISNRDTGVCGLYHDLLVKHAPEFATKHDGDGDDEEDGADDDEMMSFVWDNIVSELHRKYGDTNFILCPHSSKVVNVQQQLQKQDNINFVDVTFRTIICIIRALSDIEYIASERYHRQLRRQQQQLQQQRNSNNITNSCDAATSISSSISGGRASTLSIPNFTTTVPKNQNPVHSLNSKSHHHKRSQKRPLNDTESEKITIDASSSESPPPPSLKQQQQRSCITTRFSTGSNPKQKKQRIKNNDDTTTTIDSFSSIVDCSSPSPSSSRCKQVRRKRKSTSESKDTRETCDGDEQQPRTDNNSSWEASPDVPQSSDMFQQVDQSRLELSQKQHPPRVIIQQDDYQNEDEDDLIF